MERGSAHPLLRAVMPDGATYLFVIEADETWTICRDDRPIATGLSDHRGIERGTRLFVSLTRTGQRPPPFHDAPGTAPSAPPPD